MSVSWKNALVVALFIAGLVGSSRTAAAGTVRVLPATPTVDDSVRVVASVGFSSMCWTNLSYSCDRVGADTLSLTIDIQYCGGGPSCICAQFPITFARTCVFGRLPAGTHVAMLIEHHVNPSDPIASSTTTRAFTVDASVPAVRPSWGRLKIAYR
jgi:hypothetical protein